MKRSEAIAHFGTQLAVARALGISQPAVSAWGEDIPDLPQIQLERITNGALKADPSCYGPAAQQPDQAAA